MVAFHSFYPPKAWEKEYFMAKLNWKGSTLLGPVPPVMVSCGTPEHPNIITIAWTGRKLPRPAAVSSRIF